ncbi:MAG: 3-isopropylmalate dehydrogenase [Clostridiales bacterium]|nr:3-isopropylmalate dehydrogenase [Clostridiales bacterium]
MDFNITLLPGDGVGPEVIDSAVEVLVAVQNRFGHDFNLHRMSIGGAALDATGVPLPGETLEDCKYADAILVGAVGGPKWDNLKPHLRPAKSLSTLRQELGLIAHLHPAFLHEELVPCCPLRSEVSKKGFDIMVVSETTGGVHRGERGYRDGSLGQEAFDTEVYSISEIESIAQLAFEFAMTRGKKVTSVDRSDLLETSRLWRATVDRVAKRYPEVTLRHMHVGLCAIQLIQNPSQFDIILSPNMYGDIIADQATALTGSLCMLSSCSLGAGNKGLYAPIHGAMSGIAGKDEVNPIAAILSAAMMLSTSLKLVNEAYAIENAVNKVLARGLRTKDIAAGKRFVSRSRMTEEIALAVLNG